MRRPNRHSDPDVVVPDLDIARAAFDALELRRPRKHCVQCAVVLGRDIAAEAFFDQKQQPELQ